MRDPLKSTSAAERELFESISRQMDGLPAEVAQSLAVNLLVNSIRQMVPDRKDAEAKIDALFGRAKTVLLEQHYDAVTGKRRSVFPFTQVLEAPFHAERDVIFPTR